MNATASQIVVKAYTDRLDTSEAHGQFWSALLDYYYVGGMPAAINQWISPDCTLVESVLDVRNVHRNLIDHYMRDFGKFSGSVGAQHIESVFKNIPKHLSLIHI